MLLLLLISGSMIASNYLDGIFNILFCVESVVLHPLEEGVLVSTRLYYKHSKGGYCCSYKTVDILRSLCSEKLQPYQLLNNELDIRFVACFV